MEEEEEGEEERGNNTGVSRYPTLVDQKTRM